MFPFDLKSGWQRQAECGPEGSLACGESSRNGSLACQRGLPNRFTAHFTDIGPAVGRPVPVSSRRKTAGRGDHACVVGSESCDSSLYCLNCRGNISRAPSCSKRSQLGGDTRSTGQHVSPAKPGQTLLFTRPLPVITPVAQETRKDSGYHPPVRLPLLQNPPTPVIRLPPIPPHPALLFLYIPLDRRPPRGSPLLPPVAHLDTLGPAALALVPRGRARLVDCRCARAVLG